MEDKARYEVTEQAQLGLVQHGMNSIFLDVARFEFAQRVAQVFAKSTMVPDHFRDNIGNCMIALNLAERTGTDPFMLMQNMYIVHGRPGIEAKLAIALFNDGRTRFEPPLEYFVEGKDPKDSNYRCRAYAKIKGKDKILYGEWVDWPLVKSEGWLDKSGSKWKTMPGQMFIYRAAMFFIRAYEPGVLLGLRTKDELDDMIIDVTPRKTLETSGNKPDPGKDIYAVNGDNKGDSDKSGDPPPTPGDDDKPLFDRLKAARVTYCQMVRESIDEVSMMTPDEVEYLKNKWKGKTDDPWPLSNATEEPVMEQAPQPADGEDIPMPDLSNGKNGSDFHAWLDDVKSIVGPAKYAQGLREVGIESITKITPLQQTKAREWFNRAVDEME